VRHARHRLWQPAPSFPSLAALNDWLETRCRELWAQTPHASHPGAIADAWAEEVRHLMQPSRPFDGFVEYAKRVSPTCLVHLDRNRYSVPRRALVPDACRRPRKVGGLAQVLQRGSAARGYRQQDPVCPVTPAGASSPPARQKSENSSFRRSNDG